jgi:dTDP-4-dehydrorhamnose 3,5-epimerase
MSSLKVLKTKTHIDSRGTFSRIFDSSNPEVPKFEVLQSNISYNPTKGTLRGMHFQQSGPPEDKIVCLLSGSVFMAIIDIRPSSPTFMQKIELNLFSPLQEAIYIPTGYATGWISTAPETSLQYLMSARFEDCTYSGFRFNDTTHAINWPAQPTLISEQDRTWPNFEVEGIQL